MFKRHDVHLISNPVCTKPIADIDPVDFQWYDKDGFELNQAERRFYHAMGYPIDNPVLNHCAWQEPWFEIDKPNLGLILDHSIFLCRASYEGAAAEQLAKLKTTIPFADYLMRTKQKWGYDFALDFVQDGNTFEVLHVEYDNNNYDAFESNMIGFDQIVRHRDWVDIANRVWQNRDQWQHLKGFDQNHWKAKFILGWNKSEFTEKSV